MKSVPSANNRAPGPRSRMDAHAEEASIRCCAETSSFHETILSLAPPSSHRGGWSGLLARARLRTPMATAPCAQRRRAAWLDAASGRLGAPLPGCSASLASAAPASAMESAQQTYPHLFADRTRAGGAVCHLRGDLGLHRGRPVLHPSGGHAHAPATRRDWRAELLSRFGYGSHDAATRRATDGFTSTWPAAWVST